MYTYLAVINTFSVVPIVNTEGKDCLCSNSSYFNITDLRLRVGRRRSQGSRRPVLCLYSAEGSRRPRFYFVFVLI